MSRRLSAFAAQLLDQNHAVKGARGKIAQIGGSPNFSGAPYFSSQSSLEAGADLAYVYCHPAAVVPLKCYSPDLMVIGVDQCDLPAKLARATAIAIGAGCGQDDLMLNAITTGIKISREKEIPCILDADAFRMPSGTLKKLLSDHPWATLTPNLRELELLEKEFEIDKSLPLESSPKIAKTGDATVKIDDDLKRLINRVYYLAQIIGGRVIILLKAEFDIITDGKEPVLISNHEGCKRRCGGLGDLLGGTLAALTSLSPKDRTTMIPALASRIVRMASKKAESEVKGYMKARDVMNFLGEVTKGILKG